MPSSTVRTFTDPDVYHAATRDTQAEGIITGRGNFRAEYTSVRLDGLALSRGVESLPRITYSAFDPNLFVIGLPISSGPALSFNGLEASHGDIIAFRAGSTGYNRSIAACKWGAIVLGHEDLAAAGQTIIGRELTAPPVTHRIKPRPARR